MYNLLLNYNELVHRHSTKSSIDILNLLNSDSKKLI